ncbi:tetratricopeptide repeat protein [Stieleria varia]|uniref:Tetratricopeptide repeat protein n=1 Tax=Stieleria varia TaxID=2528005 RepID=A0A5C6B9M2_9BACT|nr:tetratricopeptide repeat protein [Stieleria varia]TWU08417.1 Tetratricopeptide repeat protein [Stieleria varia]
MNSTDPKYLAAQLVNLAFDDVSRGDFRAAKSKLEKSLQLNERCADAHSEYALVLLKLDQHPKAEFHIMRAIELEPRSPKFWLALAKWHFDIKQFDQASKSVLVAEAIDPNFPSVALAKMHILNARGGSPQSIEALGEQARQIYNQTGKRADGTKLQMGDIERFLTL